ncbi:hypothetical protein E6O75_ATG10941 [Venturia nashicola]|uniref:Uncharacterized protein n=1 Tax=Venturia nashicola TaxID=86259 RepID=A0A4Z1P124_9PEZI|nr:hypothetical protein E6O75_ATG10941 [Venturia nashicola]
MTPCGDSKMPATSNHSNAHGKLYRLLPASTLNIATNKLQICHYPLPSTRSTHYSTMRTMYITRFADCLQLGHHQAEDWVVWKCEQAEIINKFCIPCARGERAHNEQKTKKCEQCYGT